MFIYIVRHGKANHTITSDYNRDLNKKGIEQAKKLGAYIKERPFPPELIISSPLVRAKQTSQYIAANAGNIKVIEDDRLACGMRPASAIDILIENPCDSVMLVGHQPDVSVLAAYFLGLNSNGNIHFGTATCACIDIDYLDKANGVLMSMVAPEWV